MIPGSEMPSRSAFPTTRWSQVLVSHGDHTEARAALNDLCQKYWRPIYALARHRGLSPHDAEDITQAYFAALVERGYLRQARHERGRFRAFLIHDFKFHLANHQTRDSAQKRGGQLTFIQLDVAWAEARQEPADPAQIDADAYFDRQWALETVRHAKAEVAADYADQGKSALFDQLQRGLVTTPDAAMYAEWATKLDMTPNALKTALSRLRDRFRTALESQILQTVSDENELREEMRHLRAVLSKQR